jgi:hypothetical protein
VPFTAVGSELLFEVFSQRYERGATLVTSNLPLDAVDLDLRLTEHLEMPQRLTGESLRSGSLIRIIPCMAIAFRSATDALGEERG